MSAHTTGRWYAYESPEPDGRGHEWLIGIEGEDPHLPIASFGSGESAEADAKCAAQCVNAYAHWRERLNAPRPYSVGSNGRKL